MPYFKIEVSHSDTLTKDEIDSFFYKLRNINYNKDEGSEYGNMIFRFLFKASKVNGFFMGNTKCTIRKNNRLFRTRAMSKKEIKQIDSFNHFWEPPKEYVGLGRLNRENIPKLYVSHNNYEIAILENKEIKKHFILIEYEVINELNLTNLGKRFAGDLFFKNEENLQEIFDEMDNFFIRLLTYKEETNKYYWFTNGVVEKVFGNFSESKNGYYYHSAVKSDGINFCLDPSYARQNLRIKNVYHLIKGKENYIKKINLDKIPL